MFRENGVGISVHALDVVSVEVGHAVPHFLIPIDTRRANAQVAQVHQRPHCCLPCKLCVAISAIRFKPLTLALFFHYACAGPGAKCDARAVDTKIGIHLFVLVFRACVMTQLFYLI